MIAPLAGHRDAVPVLIRFLRRVIIHADGAVIFVLFAPAKLFAQGFFNLGAGAQGINQFVIERVFRGIAVNLTQAFEHALRARGTPAQA